MKKTFLFALLSISSAAIALAACGGDDTNGGGGGGTDAGGGSDTSTGNKDSGGTTDSGPGVDSGGGMDAGDSGPMNPAPPALKTQIDRMGRPAVNTALNHVFDTNATTKGAAKDAYNADKTPANWTTYVPEFAKNLAILDSLDTVCGNQAVYDMTKGYAPLASVLAGDMLWLNAGNATCKQYLGVELNATGIFMNNDCGGRTPSEDVIDETYSVVAKGALSGVTR